MAWPLYLMTMSSLVILELLYLFSKILLVILFQKMNIVRTQNTKILLTFVKHKKGTVVLEFLQKYWKDFWTLQKSCPFLALLDRKKNELSFSQIRQPWFFFFHYHFFEDFCKFELNSMESFIDKIEFESPSIRIISKIFILRN